MRFQFRLAAAIGLLAAFVAIPGMAQKKELPVCATCHEAAVAGILPTHHGAKVDAEGGMCQTCHGDTSAHLKDPAVKPANLVAKGTAEQQSAVCLTCHAGNRQLNFWESGKHAKNDVACTNCHAIHGGVIEGGHIHTGHHVLRQVLATGFAEAVGWTTHQVPGNPRRYALGFPIGGAVMLAIYAGAVRACRTGKIAWRGTSYTSGSATPSPAESPRAESRERVESPPAVDSAAAARGS